MSGPVASGEDGLAAVLEREDAAIEERHWVRLTRLCNNRCMFCHDADRQDGSVVPLATLMDDIRSGRARGATRLVLSGGEPTIHPELPAIVEEGHRAGYRWVQVISNGRMFAYDRFTNRAVASGIDEVTVSVHGHTPELHDRLVGIKGAFAQTVRGVRNLLRSGRVVSVDVVVSRPNVRHLGDIIRLFMGLGIREYDLLHLVPFGRAFDEHRAELFFDAAEERDHVLRALRLAGTPGMHLWTNRWPAPLLEGAEHLIQDPHKILDEVRGTREGFTAYLETGETPWCRGERCPHCFMCHFCDSLFRDRERLVAGAFDVVAMDAREAGALGAGALAVIARQKTAAYRLRAQDAHAAEEALRSLPRGDEALLELDVSVGDLSSATAERVRRVVVRSGGNLSLALSIPATDVEVPLSRATLALAGRAVGAAPERAVLVLAGRSRLSEVLAEDLPPDAIASAVSGARSEALPPCLAPAAGAAASVLDAATLRPDGVIDLFAWAEAYVREKYRTRSLRCGCCADVERCPGVHVNFVRAHGFGWMHPREAQDA